MNILVTGAAGFIGNAVSLSLLARGHSVLGLDNLNDYYSVELKKARLGRCKEFAEQGLFSFKQLDITNTEDINKFFGENKFDSENKVISEELLKTLPHKTTSSSVPTKFDGIIHLAAQAGVRYSLENPYTYIDTNIKGTLNLLEACRRNSIDNFVYASSSSVYGDNAKIPFSTEDIADFPVSLYAATKRSTELIAHTYSHLFGIKAVGLRFFTVYGEWGRPDMAPMLFAKNILADRPIKIFNNGNMRRDFTYIDDIVNGTIGIFEWNAARKIIENDKNAARTFNIGRGEPVDLLNFVEVLENELGKKAEKEFLPMQAGDVPVTWADTSALEKVIGYKPSVSLAQGVKNFAKWYKSYYA
ncbi:NAD-dependent epimerase [Fibrobacterales bacterium]|nr:NAD-dependent epimerase [Fibrobacterales bacterium]